MRLKKSWQFRRVYDEGAKLVCDYTVVFYYRNPEECKGPSFGVVASTGSFWSRDPASTAARRPKSGTTSGGRWKSPV
jgi:RNase P protein component